MSAELSDKIIKQIEYYFGDVNLSKDKFLQEETQKDSGWVSLETLIKFNRLKQLTTDFQVIVDSLKKSESQLLEIDEENKKIRRAKPLPDNLSEFETNLKQNTVYVKGFPDSVGLDELYKYFETYGKVLQIFMRRFPANKKFKGSVFVTFETSEQMKKFLDAEEVKYENEVLHRESQEAYLIRKAPQIEKIKEGKLKKEQQKEDRIKQKQEAEEAYLREQKVLGAILHLKGCNEETTRENLKELFDNYAKVAFIDFNKGMAEAYVRFKEANKAKEALDKAIASQNNEGQLHVKSAKLEPRVLEGDEEEEYWKMLIRKLSETRDRKSGKSGRNNSRRGKRDYSKNKGDRNGGNNNKRKLDEDDDDDDGGDDGEEEAASANGKENGQHKEAAAAEASADSEAKKLKA